MSQAEVNSLVNNDVSQVSKSVLHSAEKLLYVLWGDCPEVLVVDDPVPVYVDSLEHFLQPLPKLLRPLLQVRSHRVIRDHLRQESCEFNISLDAEKFVQ